MSSSSARMKMFQSKMKGLEWSHHFPHKTYMEIFRDAQGQLTLHFLVRSGRILNSLYIIDVLLTNKNKEDPIKNDGSRTVKDYPDYKHMRAVCCHGNQSSVMIWPKT